MGRKRMLPTVAAAIALLAPVSALAVEDREGVESLPATPPLVELIGGRGELTLDPDFWAQIVANALVDQTFVLPQPVDVVKPEVILPRAPVADGERKWRIKRKLRPLGAVTYRWQGRTKTLDEFVRSTETDAVAFLRRGRLVTELYANGWSSDVRHQPWSVTKSFVSALIGIALGEGKIDSISEPVDHYLPWLTGTAWERTTIRNLLEMESGVHWDEGTPILAINTQVQQWAQLALDYHTGGAIGQTRDEFLVSLPREVPQGTRFSYNSGNTQLLAAILEAVYRRPFNEIISAKLWKPMGMGSNAMVMTDREGDAVASQGLYSRIYDLARFGQLFLRGGRTPDGRQIVPRSWVRRSTTMTENSEGEYAFQWWHGPLPGSFEASGFEGQKISVAPSHCMVGVRLSHTLGATLTPGGDPGDPGAYGFAVEMGGDEWSAAFRAVARRLSPCRRDR